MLTIRLVGVQSERDLPAAADPAGSVCAAIEQHRAKALRGQHSEGYQRLFLDGNAQLGAAEAEAEQSSLKTRPRSKRTDG